MIRLTNTEIPYFRISEYYRLDIVVDSAINS